jgi:hypothetical protein
MGHQVKHPWFDLARLSVAAQFEAVKIQLKFTKGQNHARSPIYTCRPKT